MNVVFAAEDFCCGCQKATDWRDGVFWVTLTVMNLNV